MKESQYTEQFCASLINEEPQIFMDCTQSECFGVLLRSLPIALVVAFIATYLLPYFAVFFICLMLSFGLSSFIMIKRIPPKRLNKPRGYLKHKSEYERLIKRESASVYVVEGKERFEVRRKGRGNVY